MKLQRKIGIGILCAIGLIAFHFLYFVNVTEPMVGWAVRDSIVRAATRITPRTVLWSMCVIAVAVSLLVPFSTFIFDQIPYFRKQRIAEQSLILKEEIAKWKGFYAEETKQEEPSGCIVPGVQDRFRKNAAEKPPRLE